MKERRQSDREEKSRRNDEHDAKHWASPRLPTADGTQAVKMAHFLSHLKNFEGERKGPGTKPQQANIWQGGREETGTPLQSTVAWQVASK